MAHIDGYSIEIQTTVDDRKKLEKLKSVVMFEEMGAYRENKGKLEWSIIDFKSLEPLVKVMMWGRDKYGRDNWKKGFNKEELLDSLMRHVIALQSGELDDPEHGLSHVAGVLFNAMAFQYCRDNNKFIE